MWPATGMLVAGGLTALALRWRILVQTFQSLRNASAVSPPATSMPVAGHITQNSTSVRLGASVNIAVATS